MVIHRLAGSAKLLAHPRGRNAGIEHALFRSRLASPRQQRLRLEALVHDDDRYGFLLGLHGDEKGQSAFVWAINVAELEMYPDE